jgi:pyruvate ferredoxin oxidoreductase beta subunit
MITESFARMKDLPTTHVMGPGTSICPGCGGLAAIKEFYDILGENTVFVNAAGCMSLLSVYPYTPFPGSWLYTSMASAPAGAQGVRDALDILKGQGKIQKADDLDVVVLTGDGAANGIGMSATSGAFDRNLDYYYLCYDNEGYGNTGQQSSPATPHGAKTSTSTGSHGFKGYKKDLFAIWVAHKPAYAATVIAAEPLDLARKIEKARSFQGPKMFIALSPCPTGWNFEAAESVEIGRMAVKTGIWPLREYADGKIVHTRVPRSRPPVEEFLKLQGRFSHLFEPARDEATIGEIQAEVDTYWAQVETC